MAMDEFTSVIHAANEEAMKAGTETMGAAQLMLAILRQPDAEATIILRAHGITEENYRDLCTPMYANARPPPPTVDLGASTHAIRIYR
jgi:ATP-dependent Clp protease ATP-binding subunit ClpA